MIVTPYLFKRDMINDGVVSITTLLKDKFNLFDSFIYQNNATVPSLEGISRKSSLMNINYSIEDGELESRRTTSPHISRNIITDNQFKLSVSMSTVRCKIDITINTKSEIKTHTIRDYIASKYYTKTRFLFGQILLYRIDGSINKILDFITESAQRCMGVKVDIPTYLTHQSSGLTQIGTEAGAEGSVEYGLKTIIDNEAYIKSVTRVEYDETTGHYKFNFTLDTRLFIVDKNILMYDDVIYNEFIPDFMVENKELNIPIKKGTDTFFKIVDSDTRNVLPTIPDYNLIFSILLLKEYLPDGTFNPIMLNLRELGDYTIPDSFLYRLRDGVNNKETWCQLTVLTSGDKFKKYRMEIDNDFNVIFHDVPDCGTTLRLCLYISDEPLLNPPDGEIICYKDNCICSVPNPRIRGSRIPRIIQFSKIVAKRST